MYVFLVTLDARQAFAVGDAAEPQDALFGQRMEERIARVLPAVHLVAQELQHGRDYVGLVCEALNPHAILKPLGIVDDERYSKALLVDGVTMQQAAMLTEALPVIAVDDEDRIIVEAQLL